MLTTAETSAPLVITPGEPAGIGPDICLQLAAAGELSDCLVFANAELLANRAKQLGLSLQLLCEDAPVPQPGDAALRIKSFPLAHKVRPGIPNPANAVALLDALDEACRGCLKGEYAALVTGPLHKASMSTAERHFSGHTEYLAQRCGGTPVMLLATGDLRVALATTHLPLSAVPKAITKALLIEKIQILAGDLKQRFGLSQPRIMVCGLNPHAGEEGQLGSEEIDVIIPALEQLRHQGFDVVGPLPADTAFTPKYLHQADAFFAMYHDQGLPVLKYAGFGQAVNITLGLSIIRSSVDHGTAFDLAGSGKADTGSLRTALAAARDMVNHQRAPA